MADDELVTSLRGLANRFALNARDYARDAKAHTDPEKAAYNRGLSEAFYKAALDLAAVLKREEARAPLSRYDELPETDRLPPQGRLNQPQKPVSYAPITQLDAIRLLEFAGATPRDVTVRSDNTIYAVFSKLQPLAESERVRKIQGADARIVILEHGRVRDSGDYYVEFALKSR